MNTIRTEGSIDLWKWAALSIDQNQYNFKKENKILK